MQTSKVIFWIYRFTELLSFLWLIINIIIDRYETENGIVAEENGQIERDGNGDDVLRTVGFYRYTGDDGKEYRVDYTADAENGFVAKVMQNVEHHFINISLSTQYWLWSKFLWFFFVEGRSFTYNSTDTTWDSRAVEYFGHETTRRRQQKLKFN